MSDQNPVFIPGPTNIPERLRHAMDRPTMDHRSPAFPKVLGEALDAVKQVLRTSTGQVVTFPGSGTGAWEAAMTNCLSQGDTVLAADHGMFSHRWVDLCQRLGFDVQVVDAPWGEGTPVETFAGMLKADTDRKIKAVLVTHNETATGVTSDVAGVRAALDAADHPALLMVDGVSSIGCIDFRMDDWRVDIAVTGSQKGFMLSTGMAILGVSQKAIKAMETASFPNCYFDIPDMMAKNAGGGYPYTPTTQLLFGLKESLDMLMEEGLENVFARHHRLAEGVRKAVDAWGLKLCAARPALHSDTVSAIYVPQGFDGTDLINHAFNTYGMSFGGGLGKVAGKVFRIGHLGSLTESMLLSGLATIEMSMADLNYPIQLGSGVAAAQEHYRTTARGAAPVTDKAA